MPTCKDFDASEATALWRYTSLLIIIIIIIIKHFYVLCYAHMFTIITVSHLFAFFARKLEFFTDHFRVVSCMLFTVVVTM